jgi:hypothetical protein
MNRTVFLYAGSADATVKPAFQRSLRSPTITQFPHHRSVATTGPAAWLTEAFRACGADGFARVIVVGDIQADGYVNAVGAVLSALRDAHASGLLSGIKTVEVFLATDKGDEARHAIERISGVVATLNTVPYVKVYVLLSPGSATRVAAELVAFLTAITVAAPSRGEASGYGLSVLRNVMESALFLVQYREHSIPDIGSAAKLFIDRALLDETFSVRLEQSSVVPPNDQIDRLLDENGVGRDEPTTATSLEFELRRVQYRNALLHPLLTVLVRYFPQEADFLDAVDRLRSKVGNRSEALTSILGDVRNEVVAARTGTVASLAAADGDGLGLQLEQTVRELADSLLLQYRFAVWPLLTRRVRPPSIGGGVEDLYHLYERCIVSVKNAIKSLVISELRTHQVAMTDLATKAAAGMPGRWWLPPSTPYSLLLLHQDLSKDSRDELWLYQSRCGSIGLLQGELHT